MTKLSLALVFTILLLAPAALLAADSAGKDLFVDKGCSKCHAVSSAGIEAKIKSEKMQGPDLTDVASRHDGEFISKYVLKQEKLDDKSHKGSWDGSDDELKALIDWLLAQKSQ